MSTYLVRIRVRARVRVRVRARVRVRVRVRVRIRVRVRVRVRLREHVLYSVCEGVQRAHLVRVRDIPGVRARG